MLLHPGPILTIFDAHHLPRNSKVDAAMTVQAMDSVVVGAAAHIRALSVSETYWGYVIRDGRDRFDRETVLEAAMRFLGLVMVLAAYSQWLLPRSLYSGDVFITKALLALFLGVTGVTVYWFASRGLNAEVHVDLARRELRVSHLNSRGQTRLARVIPMDRIESAFIKRSKERGVPSELCLRFNDSPAILHVASGDEQDLERLHRRLTMDLRPARERIDHRLAKSLPFRSRRAA